jgi:hypothetical protein
LTAVDFVGTFSSKRAWGWAAPDIMQQRREIPFGNDRDSNARKPIERIPALFTERVPSWAVLDVFRDEST